MKAKGIFAFFIFLFLFFANQRAVALETRVQMGHSGWVDTLAFSSDGKYLASGGSDRIVKIWDLSSGKELRNFFGHTDSLDAVEFSPDGTRLYSWAFYAGSTFQWDTSSGKKLREFKGSFVSVSPDGGILLTRVGEGELMLWNTVTGGEAGTRKGYRAVSPDGRFALIGSGGSMALWDVAQARVERIFEGRITDAESVCFSRDGALILARSEKTVRLWKSHGAATTQCVIRDVIDIMTAVASKDSRFILTTAANGFKLWDAGTGALLKAFVSDAKSVRGYSAAISSEGSVIASFRYGDSIKLWDPSSGKQIGQLKGYASAILSIAFSPDGRYSLSGSEDAAVKLWDMATGRLLKQFTGHAGKVVAVDYSPDGRYALSGSYDSTAKLWDLGTGECLRTFKGPEGLVMEVSFIPGGKSVVSACSDADTISIWDIASGNEIRRIKGDGGGVHALAVSPDGRRALTGSMGAMILWDLENGTILKKISATNDFVTSVAFSPDGSHAISAGARDEKMTLWDLATGKMERAFVGHEDRVVSVSFSPDGRQALSGSDDRTIRHWDLETGSLLRILPHSPAPIACVAFSPDGRHALAGGWDALHLWDLKTGEPVYSAISDSKGQSLCWTEEGYFAGSDVLAKEALHVVDGSAVYSIDQFFDRFYRPDLIAAKYEGRPIGEFTGALETRVIMKPPLLALELLAKDGTYSRPANGGTGDFASDRGVARVKVVARDGGGGIKGLRLYNNGKLVGEHLRGLAVVEVAGLLEQYFDLPLLEGENILRAVGFSGDMTESSPAIAILRYEASATTKPDMHVLAIGIDHYLNAKYDLSYCAADAAQFSAALERKAKALFGTTYVTTILDRDATRTNILKVLDSMQAGIKASDVFVLYYAGHGIAIEIAGADGKPVSEFFYILSGVTQMTNPARCAAEGLSGSELKAIMGGIRANKQVLFVDACNSGAFAAQFALRGAAEENALAKLSRATGSVVFAATSKDQFAAELPALGHGVFTYVLLEAMEGKGALDNGQITVRSLMGYVEEKIPEYTERYRGERQYPTTFMWGMDFPIGIR